MELAGDSVEGDPAAEAIESYVEGSAQTGSDTGFPWVAAIGFLVLAAVVLVVAIRLRRRFV